uniref:Uncharacterized protein n=1 Tax=Solibacter usitatus (strain Ellin6076) TaxID=234267 RepID=Q01ZI9_SOLUE
MTRRKKWLAGIGLAAGVALIGLTIAGIVLNRRFQPYLRQQAILYLRERFHSDVELSGLHVSLPRLSPLRWALTRGRGTQLWVDGYGLVLRHKGRADLPPMFAIRKFSFAVDPGSLFEKTKVVPVVEVEGLELNLPPKDERPALSANPSSAAEEEGKTGVLLQEVRIRDAEFVMLPRDRAKKPLRFAIHQLNLHSAGTGVPMKYDARLTNPTPPGEIQSKGIFGPWNSDEPGDTPLSGDYRFDHADLGVFHGVAGILSSTGRFEGELDTITARGEATVPDFRLKRSGNRVPLKAQFEVQVDGTNGDTRLKPVTATLGATHFTTSGAVFKREGDEHRQIHLDVNMPNGRMRDVLLLAMKDSPFMEGTLRLKTSLVIPPLTGKVVQKIRLNGDFQITDGHFLRSTIQDQIDALSRRGQGQPKNQEIDEVVSTMRGQFNLEDEVISFEHLTFGVSGADVSLNGSYSLAQDSLDFHGALKLQAKVSQTMTGWKHWLLKPVDPFFAKNGAGTYLKIKVAGNAKAPKFGLDR